MKHFTILCAALSLTACATSGTPLPDSSTKAARTYRAKCSTCHSVPHPARHTREQWPPLIALMERRMAERRMPGLSEEDRAVILDYLKRNARR